MEKNNLEKLSISLIQIGQTLQNNHQAINNAIIARAVLDNIQNQLRLMRNGQRLIRNGLQLIRNDINRMRNSLAGLRRDFNSFRGVMRRRLQKMESSSVTRAYNSHQISTEAIIRWIPNGVRPNGFPLRVLDLENAQENLLNRIIQHYNLQPANVEIRDKVRLIKRFLELVV